MIKALGVVLLLLALVGCSSTPAASPSPYSSKAQCSSPTSYECQVEMYMKAGG